MHTQKRIKSIKTPYFPLALGRAIQQGDAHAASASPSTDFSAPFHVDTLIATTGFTFRSDISRKQIIISRNLLFSVTL